MKLLTNPIRKQLLANGRTRKALDEAGEADPDFVPVVKLFTPDAAATWLLTEIDPDDPDIAFGLCDLGLGFPELGAVSLEEIAALRGRLGLPVERDRYFAAHHTIGVYARAAWTAQHIVEDDMRLGQAFEEHRKVHARAGAA